MDNGLAAPDLHEPAHIDRGLAAGHFFDPVALAVVKKIRGNAVIVRVSRLVVLVIFNIPRPYASGLIRI